MAGVAFNGSYKVAIVLASRDRTVVAGRTGAEHLSVINGKHRCPDCRCMTVLTHVRGQRMLWVLAGRNCAVVTTDAIAHNIRVVISCRQPRDRRMTVITVVAASDMISILSCRCIAVMTRTATAKHLRMINGVRRLPERRVVTILAHIGRLRMRRRLTGSSNSVMTVTAISDDVHMIKIGWQPARSCMAILADIAARDMRWRFAGCRDAIVTVAAIANNTDMIKVCGNPASRRMAIVASVTAGDMRQ